MSNLFELEKLITLPLTKIECFQSYCILPPSLSPSILPS